MTSAAELFNGLRDLGFTLRLDGGTLRVSPGSRLTPELADEVRAWRAGLVELLGLTEAERQARLALDEWHRLHPAGDAVRLVELTLLRYGDEVVLPDPAMLAWMDVVAGTRAKAAARPRPTSGPGGPTLFGEG